ncbi:MAG: tetratricopeptide repeat protein [Lachnospiraceae bacterium]|nr:tetratricopeptide repeat protein [Lachnospiraceae bacterium]
MNKASIESQTGNEPVTVEDTEEMYWLRQNDDLQSKVKLGNLLSSQYRFREAIEVWGRALEEFPSEKILNHRIGAACLTLFDFEGCKAAFDRLISSGGDPKALAYPLGIMHYLQKEYIPAAECFEKILPCDGEMMIAVIYWHCLCDLRAGKEMHFLDHYDPGMDVGHHAAYGLIVSVMAGSTPADEVLEKLDSMNDLDLCIAGYGMYQVLKSRGIEDDTLLQRVLGCTDVWPNVAYLAAWNDARGCK